MQAMFDDPELNVNRADDERAMHDLSGADFNLPPPSSRHPQESTYRAPTTVEETFSAAGGWA